MPPTRALPGHKFRGGENLPPSGAATDGTSIETEGPPVGSNGNDSVEGGVGGRDVGYGGERPAVAIGKGTDMVEPTEQSTRYDSLSLFCACGVIDPINQSFCPSGYSLPHKFLNSSSVVDGFVVEQSLSVGLIEKNGMAHRPQAGPGRRGSQLVDASRFCGSDRLRLMSHSLPIQIM